jgi:hypothetical protein
VYSHSLYINKRFVNAEFIVYHLFLLFSHRSTCAICDSIGSKLDPTICHHLEGSAINWLFVDRYVSNIIWTTDKCLFCRSFRYFYILRSTNILNRRYYSNSTLIAVPFIMIESPRFLPFRIIKISSRIFRSFFLYLCCLAAKLSNQGINLLKMSVDAI